MTEFIFWRPYDTDSNYIVSSHGRVYSNKRKKFLKPYINSGYEEVYIYENKKRTHKRIHKLVACVFIPNSENKPIINHKDGNKLNNNLHNLEWNTHKENSEHANVNGLIKRQLVQQEKCYDINLSESKLIEGYDIYYIFKDGKIFSKKSNIFMKTYFNLSGYECLNLSNKKTTMYLVHRLVAQTFIPNPENKRVVNHKNGNKTDNRVENLEWVTHAENTQHASDTGANNHSKNFKPVIQYDLDGKEINRFKSMKEAVDKLNICKISDVCNKRRRTAGGYIWRFENDPL